MRIKNICGNVLAIDRYILNIDEEADVELTPETYERAIEFGYIQNLSEPEQEPEDTGSAYDSMKKNELIELCKAYGLDYKGKKVAELRQMLKEADDLE